jgi:hypothetical protein
MDIDEKKQYEFAESMMHCSTDSTTDWLEDKLKEQRQELTDRIWELENALTIIFRNAYDGDYVYTTARRVLDLGDA